MSTQARGRFCGDAAIAQCYVQYSDSVEDGQEQLSFSFGKESIYKDILKSLIFHVFMAQTFQTTSSHF